MHTGAEQLRFSLGMMHAVISEWYHTRKLPMLHVSEYAGIFAFGVAQSTSAGSMTNIYDGATFYHNSFANQPTKNSTGIYIRIPHPRIYY
jgi:hypothetical protein